MKNAVVIFLAHLFLFASSVAKAETTVKAFSRPALEVALTALIDGQVKAMLAIEGKKVKLGEPLVQLLDDVQLARVKLAQKSADSTGNVDRAQLQLERAKWRHKRLANAAKGSVPSWEIDEALYQIKMAKAELVLAEQALEVEKGKLDLETKLLDQYVITSPFEGQIVKVAVDPGATVKRNDVLVKVADISKLKVTAYIPAELAHKLKLNATYRATAFVPDAREFSAKLTFLDPKLEPASQTFRANFVVSNKNKQLRAGSEFTITIK